ncbi:Histidinol-phosphate transaminase [Saliniradius amylolyticus]|uniref:Histidinol-phosphate aminotransferase n=1 Tax=Saliniradius amylolyticus TaxID=2183582 RepID=A0A2S2E1D7_9ALTE|nr:histidinol-phosphate transaminase [Saliniradius amylolyticus]AWL11465.1 Histidinol-phosphate transaminase [Saliniradius amylolyticus]
MSNLADKLQSPHVKTLTPYQSARRLFSGGQDWLNANESPFANDYSVDASRFNRYPDCQPKTVIQSYAQYAGVEPEQLLVSRGADEGIELLIRGFCEAGKDNILICPPTYGMYAISAETFNVGVEKAPLKADFSLDMDAIESQVGKVKLVFICSPNNPTGTQVDAESIHQTLALFKDKALVVVDEAYIEFAEGENWANKLADYDNLVVLRTLSKAFGLAGLRCGFTLASPEIIEVLLKVIAPYPLAEPVAQIAAQALSAQGLATIKQQVGELNGLKTELRAALSSRAEFEVLGDTQANFVLVRTEHKQGLMDALVEQGILVRDQSKQLYLDNCLRISVGDKAQNARLLAAIDAFFKQETA